MNQMDSFLKTLRESCGEKTTETEDTLNLTLTKEQFMTKMLQEENGHELLQLLESGESDVVERLGLCHGEIKNGQVVFFVPKWNTLLAHLKIVSSV